MVVFKGVQYITQEEMCPDAVELMYELHEVEYIDYDAQITVCSVGDTYLYKQDNYQAKLREIVSILEKQIKEKQSEVESLNKAIKAWY